MLGQWGTPELLPRPTAAHKIDWGCLSFMDPHSAVWELGAEWRLLDKINQIWAFLLWKPESDWFTTTLGSTICSSFLAPGRHSSVYLMMVLKNKSSVSLNNGFATQSFKTQITVAQFVQLSSEPGRAHGSALGAPPALSSHLGDSQQALTGTYLFTDCCLQQTVSGSKAREKWIRLCSSIILPGKDHAQSMSVEWM